MHAGSACFGDWALMLRARMRSRPLEEGAQVRRAHMGSCCWAGVSTRVRSSYATHARVQHAYWAHRAAPMDPDGWILPLLGQDSSSSSSFKSDDAGGQPSEPVPGVPQRTIGATRPTQQQQQPLEEDRFPGDPRRPRSGRAAAKRAPGPWSRWALMGVRMVDVGAWPADGTTDGHAAHQRGLSRHMRARPDTAAWQAAGSRAACVRLARAPMQGVASGSEPERPRIDDEEGAARGGRAPRHWTHDSGWWQRSSKAAAPPSGPSLQPQNALQPSPSQVIGVSCPPTSDRPHRRTRSISHLRFDLLSPRAAPRAPRLPRLAQAMEHDAPTLPEPSPHTASPCAAQVGKGAHSCRRRACLPALGAGRGCTPRCCRGAHHARRHLFLRALCSCCSPARRAGFRRRRAQDARQAPAQGGAGALGGGGRRRNGYASRGAESAGLSARARVRLIHVGRRRDPTQRHARLQATPAATPRAGWRGIAV